MRASNFVLPAIGLLLATEGLIPSSATASGLFIPPRFNGKIQPLPEKPSPTPQPSESVAPEAECTENCPEPPKTRLQPQSTNPRSP